MSLRYFSERETGSRPRTSEELPLTVWGGIVATINSRVNDGSFGYRFPYTCPDGEVVCGCSERNFSLSLRAEIPDMSWPLNPIILPPKLPILDLIEFCFQSTGKPIQGDYHSYHKHYHLSYDRDNGMKGFQDDINRIFSSNGIAFELTNDGTIERLAPEGIREELHAATFWTGDDDLNTLFETARAKYLDPDLNIRKESLEKLWDGWERLKTIEDKDKKKGSTLLLNKSATEPTFRALLVEEAEKLTTVGNNFRIRHSETTKAPIESSEQVDYLFHRMFALIRLLLKKSGRGE